MTPADEIYVGSEKVSRYEEAMPQLQTADQQTTP